MHMLTDRRAQAIHDAATPFSPLIPTSLLPYIAFILLTATFGLGFYFTTSVFIDIFFYSAALTSVSI